MKYKVIVSDKASEMLQRHIAFIANVSKKSAIDKKKEIVDAIKKLKEDKRIHRSGSDRSGKWIID